MGGYSPHTQVIRWFWEVAGQWSEQQKAKLLSFATGSSRAPIGGLRNLNFVIQKEGPNSMNLPTSHTCFNTLLLPEYSSRARLRDRLEIAINNAEGFGLQ